MPVWRFIGQKIQWTGQKLMDMRISREDMNFKGSHAIIYAQTYMAFLILQKYSLTVMSISIVYMKNKMCIPSSKCLKGDQ